MSRRVLLFGAFEDDAAYPRTLALKKGLELHGVEVFTLRESLLPVGDARKKVMAQPWRWPGAAARVWWGQRNLRERLRALLHEVRFDAVIVPYPGWFSVRDARALFDGPVLLDLFFSLRDTVTCDRKMFSERGPVAAALGALDKRACRAADRVFLDTPQHARAVAELVGLPNSAFEYVPVCDPKAPSSATPPRVRSASEPARALYLGTGVPLHGVERILEAMRQVEGVELTFIGGTPEQRTAACGVDNVVRIEEWVGGAEMRQVLDDHDVVFGAFGTSDKAHNVIPLKIVHALAHGRLVLTADTPAARTLLSPGQDCLTVPVGSVEGIVRALGGVRDGPLLVEHLACAARLRYERTFSARATGRRLVRILESVSGESWDAAVRVAREPAVSLA